MRGGDVFFDTNILLYLISEDITKADRAETLLALGGVISVQVLNEFAAVALRKQAVNFTELRQILATYARSALLNLWTLKRMSLG